jgi:thioredoxin-related protein
MKNYIALFLLVFSSSFLISSCNDEDVVEAVPNPEGFIQDDWAAAKQAAGEANRQIFIHFYKPDCPRCAEFKEDVLNDEEVETYVFENYIGTFVNAKEGEGKDLADEFDVKGTPSLAVTDKNGKLLELHTGKMAKEKFLNWLKEKKE